MALDPYASCPCGSGKKFKWCCQPVHVQISKAFEQDAEGQHEAALRAMDAVIAEHPGNPEVWGRKAQLLFQLEKSEEAEKALAKAFEINPNYPFGHLLQGKFRQYEGEIAGALSLFRKAAHLYDPEAKSVLAQLQAMIADCELKLNRPVAARAGLQLAIRLAPAVNDYRQALEQIFDKQSSLPAAARKEYSYRGLPKDATPSRRTAWEHALSAAGTGKLADAARAFEQLVKEEEADAAAWFNLALTRAWEGNNASAVDALERYIGIEPDEALAIEAGALTEVLRCGQGLEDQSDYVSHFVVFGLREPQAFLKVLADLEKERRLIGVQVRQEEGILHGMMVEKVQALTPELEAKAAPRLAAFFIMAGPVGRLWQLNRDAVEACARELRERAGPAIDVAESGRGPANFVDITCEWLVFPAASSEEEGRTRVEEGCARFLEETWIHRPLVSLNRIPPVDAAGHAGLRKKLLGVIQFLQQCGDVAGMPYDFDRLRRKLGLISGVSTTTGPAAADFSSLGASELASIAPESLSDEQAEQAYQAALKLDARELAGRFAKNLISRPPDSGRADRYAWYGHLAQLALSEGHPEAALQYLQDGEQVDVQHNEGKRRNDYELRRGQVLAKKGDIEPSQSAFDELIRRAPAEPRYRGAAAEAMLSARQLDRALRFAQDGLALARKQNDRDSEEYFKELVSAASNK